MPSSPALAAVRRHWLYLTALTLPLAVWLGLLAFPRWDVEVLAGKFHLIVMTIVSCCALAVASIAARASTQVRQPGAVLLAAGCLVVGLLLLGHGLTTPFVFGQPLNQWVSRFPYGALGLFAVFLGLAATNWAKRSLMGIARHPVATLAAVGVPIAVLVAVVSVSPTSLHGSEPVSSEAGIRDAIAYLTVAILVPVSLVHWRRFRLGLDVVQASLSIAALMSAAAMLSMHFGQLWRLSWWDYHGCLLAGFAGASYAIFKRWGETRTTASVLDNAFEHDPLKIIAKSYPTPLRNLVTAMEVKDTYTHGHSARTAALAVSIGARMNLSADRLRILAQGAYLHDIGKLAISDDILNKPGRLTAEEREVINTHPQIGRDIAAAHDVLEPCLPIILHHHERFDGGGYPSGLDGDSIPLLARIAAVADVWDALTSDRSYRPGWSTQRALDHIVAGAGAHLDPKIVAVLLDIAADLGVIPSGLDTDATAIDTATADCHESGANESSLAVGQSAR